MVVFYFGFLFGIRENINSEKDEITLIGPNGANQNFITQIQKKDVSGLLNSEKIATYGEMLFIVEEKKTQILISLKDIPNSVKQTKSSNKLEKAIPSKLNVALARRTVDGLDYEYEIVGELSFDAPKNNSRSGQFSKILEQSFSDTSVKSIQRIELQPIDKNKDFNLFSEDNPNLPIEVRKKPAPFFWINL